MNNIKNIEFKIGKFAAGDLKEIGCFVSYRHDDCKILDEIIDKCADVNILSDRLIESGCSDFNNKIKTMIAKSTSGVVIYNGGVTPWMMYEIGMLKAMKKPLYIYTSLTPPAFFNDFQKIDSLDELHRIIKQNSLFSDIFIHESEAIDKAAFNSVVLDKLRYANLSITIPGLKEFNPNSYRFSFIVSGLFKIEKETAREKICHKNKEALGEAFCKCYDRYNNCPLVDTRIEKGKPDTIILNKIYDAIDTSGDVVKYILPVSVEYGLTFKCFVDILDFSIKDKLTKILQNAGVLSLEQSWSAASDRMYFLLPKRVQNNLFVIENSGGFCDNYICPGGVL